MELKHMRASFGLPSITLLIVPYGIETSNHHVQTYHIDKLLIVPYGIETDVF